MASIDYVPEDIVDDCILPESRVPHDGADSPNKHIYPKEEMIVKDGKGYINDKDDKCEQFYMPSSRNDVATCTVRRDGWNDKEMYGKWMAFRRYNELDTVWKEIVYAMKETRLGNCWVAKCSTLYYSPSSTGPGPHTVGVISVHTSKSDLRIIGDKFIHIVKQDIKYKLNTSTLSDKYGYKGHKPIHNMLYYNAGSPVSSRPTVKCSGLSTDKKDIWNTNEVSNPKYCYHGQGISQWILLLQNEELTHMWHKIKQQIVDGNIRAFKMVCPPLKKPRCSDEKASFQVYVVEDEIMSVGMNLIAIVCRDITLMQHNGLPPSVMSWNNGQPYC